MALLAWLTTQHHWKALQVTSKSSPTPQHSEGVLPMGEDGDWHCLAAFSPLGGKHEYVKGYEAFEYCQDKR